MLLFLLRTRVTEVMGATPMYNIENVISAKAFILDLFEKGACTFGIYSKTCVKHTQLDKKMSRRQMVASRRSNVLHNSLLEHSAILSTCIKQ